jgi:hypothetical protein
MMVARAAPSVASHALQNAWTEHNDKVLRNRIEIGRSHTHRVVTERYASQREYAERELSAECDRNLKIDLYTTHRSEAV